MNMKNKNFEKRIAAIHKVLSSPFRIRLLYTLREGEACVCHLESIMKKRQAYISQQLMVLRDAGILLTRREGKFIFYRVASEDVFQLVESAAKVGGLQREDLHQSMIKSQLPECVCPKCAS
jgi:ArsR family transcriptional regulator